MVVGEVAEGAGAAVVAEDADREGCKEEVCALGLVRGKSKAACAYVFMHGCVISC